MNSRLPRILAPIVELRHAETTTALLMFAYSFLAMTAYNIVKPVTRSKFIGDLGADNLPYVLLAAGLLVGVVMQLYSRLIGVLPKRWVILCTGCGMMTLMVAFWVLFRADQAWVSVGFYLFGLIIGILLISQFWTLANDIYDPRQAKRLFGFIGGGASLGGMTGAGLTAVLAGAVGTDNLLLGSTSVLAACMLVVAAILRREKRPGRPDTPTYQAERLSGQEALRLLQQSRHLQIIALVIGFAAVGAAIIEQQLNMAAEAFRGRHATDAITAFLAQITLYVSAIGFIVQVGFTSRIHRLLGIGFALLVLPVSLGATALVMLLNAALWAPAFARVLDSSLRYSLDKTTREVLFLPLPTELKYQAKPFVDVSVDRLAKGVAALLLLVLIKGLGFTWQQLSYASLTMTALWVVTAVRARREYLARFRRSLEQQEMRPAQIRLRAADRSAVEILARELGHPDERRVLYAIDLLEAVDRQDVATPVLLHHASPRIRARVLQTLEPAMPEVQAASLQAVEHLLHNDSADVRAAAVRALVSIRHRVPADLMQPYLSDVEPRVVVAAAIALARSEDRDDVAAAEAALTRLSSNVRPEAAAARREVAAGLSEIPHQTFRRLLVPLMYDPDTDVARTAVRSVERLGTADPLFLPTLISLLGHRLLRRHAQDALARYGDELVDALAHFLEDPNEHVWVRRHIPATLARIPSEKSVRVLVGALGERDGFLRYKVVRALEQLRGEHPELAMDVPTIEALALREGSNYLRYLCLHSALTGGNGLANGSLLEAAIEEKLERTLDRIYRLLGLIYPPKDVSAARWAIEHGPARLRADAVEYLDNVLSRPLRRHLMPIVEDLPLDEKACKAAQLVNVAIAGPAESLGQLLQDGDPVIASTALHAVGERQLAVLAEDLEAVVTRQPAHRFVAEAAGWALAATRRPGGPNATSSSPPLVEIVARLHRIPLFAFVSVDELFRIAEAGRLTRYDAGHTLHRQGQAHDVLCFLLSGAVALEEHGRQVGELRPPAALAFEEVVEPCPMPHTARTIQPVICLTLTSTEFFTLLSGNAELTRGLFRMLLANPVLASWRNILKTDVGALLATRASRELTAVELTLFLRQIPLFARAGAAELLELAERTRHMPFSAGARPFSEGDPPAICLLVSGQLGVEDPDGNERACARPGDVIGVYDTLVGTAVGCRGEVRQAGAALRIESEDLFDLLADHIDLLRGVFSAICTRPLAEAALPKRVWRSSPTNRIRRRSARRSIATWSKRQS